MAIKLVLLDSCYLVTPNNADWEGFVYNKMQDFGSYIKEKGFDPTPALGKYAIFSDSTGVVGLDTYLSYLSMSDFWRHIKPAYTRIDWLKGEFDIGLQTDIPFVVTGKPVTNWKVNSTSLSSQGIWTSHQKTMYFKDCSIQFRVLPSGYLNVTEVYKCWSSWNSYNVSFEGISGNRAAAGYEDILEGLLDRAVLKYYGPNAHEPITYIFGEFWKEILSNTTLGEFIAYTGTWEPAPSTTPYWIPRDNPKQQKS